MIDETISRRRSGTTVVVNRGLKGNRVIDLKERWDEDCISVDADLVSILIGVNDTRRRYDDNDPTSAELFAETYGSILGRLRESGGRENRPRGTIHRRFYGRATELARISRVEDRGCSKAR